MKNIVVCKNCNNENEYYNLNCSKCNAYIRSHIYNIDLWNTISQLLYSPKEAFTNIVFSDHKNFVIPLMFVIALKFLFNIFFIAPFVSSQISTSEGFITKYLVVTLILFILIYFTAWILTIITKSVGCKGRVKDYFSILVYSLIFYISGAIILYPIEFISFGPYLHSISPSPFVLKPLIAYILSGIELLIIVWSIFLLINGLFVQTKNLLFSIVTGIVVNLFYILIMYSGSLLLFNLR